MKRNDNKLQYSGKLVTYAQHLEDIILFGYFKNIKKTGFYIDIGANHPKHDSVTKFFSLRGWRGINVEPQEYLCNLLDEDRPKDINLAIGISDKPGTETLRQYDSNGLSTFSTNLQSGYAQSGAVPFAKYKDVELEIKRLDSVLSRYAKKRVIDFMKIDVEGYEYKVIKSNDWQKYRPSILCVEATGSDKRWQKILLDAKYELHIKDGLNEYYVASERKNLIENYHAYVASEVIRYDIAELPIMQVYKKVISIGKKTKVLLRKSNRQG